MLNGEQKQGKDQMVARARRQRQRQLQSDQLGSTAGLRGGVSRQ
jgi:hypothetical protein